MCRNHHRSFHARRSTLATLGSVALLVVAASPVYASSDAERDARDVKRAIIEFAASSLTLREAPVPPPPHLELLFDVDRRGEPIHAHHLPGWLKISLDGLPSIEHTYSDDEWHALTDGGLHLLLPPTPVALGSHTLTVHFKGIDRNGRPYLRMKTFSFEALSPSDHRVLRFRATANEEPGVSLETLGESLLRSPTSGKPTDEQFFRIGLFEAASGNHPTAAAYFLAALDPKVAGTHRTESRLRLAEAYAKVGAPEEAESLLEQVATEEGDGVNRARAWFLIERIAAHEGRHRRVLEAHARFGPALPPQLVGEAYTLAGLSALALRDYAQASALFRAVPKSSVDAPLALFGQAQALAGEGDAYTAGSMFAKLGDTRTLFDPVQSRVNEYAHAALGLQLVAQGRYEEAIVQLGRVPPDHPLSNSTLFAIGWCLRGTGEHVKAIAVFDDLLARDPEGRYAHEAQLATAASYADLRATTRSVAAYRAALDALSASSAALDRARTRVRDPAWDPLSQADSTLPAEARRVMLDDPAVVRATERYHWLIRFGQDLRRALDRFPGFLAAPQGSTTLGGRLHTVDGSHLIVQGNDLLARLDVVKNESRDALALLVNQALDHEQSRLEEWSVAASLGIARNLRDDVTGEVLTLE